MFEAPAFSRISSNDLQAGLYGCIQNNPEPLRGVEHFFAALPPLKYREANDDAEHKTVTCYVRESFFLFMTSL